MTPLVKVVEQMSEFGFYVARVLPNGGGEANSVSVSSAVFLQKHLDIETSRRFLELTTSRLDSTRQREASCMDFVIPLR